MNTMNKEQQERYDEKTRRDERALAWLAAVVLVGSLAFVAFLAWKL